MQAGWITIKTIKNRNSALGTRSIAKFLGISHNTVRRRLKSKDVPDYDSQRKINFEIEPYLLGGI